MKYQFAAALVLVAMIALVNPHVESGMNDDWSFIHTARDLAATGQLRYNGWSAPLIGFQAYWAALFIKTFGFSFLAARASVWVLALLSIPVLWRLFLSVELSGAQALFGLMLFLLSPLVLPNLTTFMTDMPAFFLFAAALLCALNAWRSAKDNSSMLWAGASSCFAMLSGSVRQFYWLGGVCFLVVLGLARFRSTRGRVVIGLCISPIVLFGAWASAWLAHQPYVPADQTIEVLRQASWQDLGAAGLAMARALVGLAVLSLPVTLPLAWSRLRSIPIWIKAAILCLSVTIPVWLADPMPWLGNTITNYGVTISENLSVGDKPAVLSANLMLALAALGLAAAFCSFGAARNVKSSPELGRFAALTVPFLLLYTMVLAVRAPGSGLYDRYFIPHLFVIFVLASARLSRRVNWVTLATGGVFALYALATTHDYFAEAGAKFLGAEEVVRAGNPRTGVLAGFEYDAWTQTEVTGYVNNEPVRFPAGAFQQIDDCNGPDETQAWWRSLEPDLQARYVVTLTPIAGLRKSEFADVEYGRWLPFRKFRVYVEQVAQGKPALTCKPDTGS